MVSLENTKNTKGGFSFEAITPTNDDFIETVTTTNPSLLDADDRLPLTVEVEPGFKQISTTFMIVFQILIIIGFEASLFLLPYFCTDEFCNEFTTFDIITFVHCVLWFFMFMFDRYFHLRHMQSRRNGYLEFYRVTRLRRSMPLIIFSAANSLLIVLIKIIPKYCPEKCTSLKLDPINFLQIFISVENLLIVSILINYLVLTIKFNRSKKLPDISKEIDRPIFTPSQLKDVGYKDSSYLSNILENQADMIRYLQERNATLTHKLYSKSNTNIANIN